MHEQYRGYKTASIETEQRLQQYKLETQKAFQAEREAKKESHRLRLENDELLEKVNFLESRYNLLIQRLENGGASQEEIQALEELLHQ